EVPPALVQRVRGGASYSRGHVDLYAERHQVRESVQKTLYTGKTYNSVENIRQFFTDRPAAAAPKPSAPAAQPRPPAPKAKKTGVGSTVDHVKYGRGTIVRVEGSGEDAKLTVSFPRYGLKKLVAKYAGIHIE
ncbi:MAG TPA: ATP-dependent DNA helicase Rep, partial [Bryobacteraceae bacterium]|nr:ATP-dependent DNA helicase Rep [Bryobacteraceae bacterium]